MRSSSPSLLFLSALSFSLFACGSGFSASGNDGAAVPSADAGATSSDPVGEAGADSVGGSSVGGSSFGVGGGAGDPNHGGSSGSTSSGTGGSSAGGVAGSSSAGGVAGSFAGSSGSPSGGTGPVGGSGAAGSPAVGPYVSCERDYVSSACSPTPNGLAFRYQCSTGTDPSNCQYDDNHVAVCDCTAIPGVPGGFCCDQNVNGCGVTGAGGPFDKCGTTVGPDMKMRPYLYASCSVPGNPDSDQCSAMGNGLFCCSGPYLK